MRTLLITVWLCSPLAVLHAAPAPVEFIGSAFIEGDSRDKSRLYNVLGGKIPHNRLGSFGSGIDFTGADDLYIACDDRGPGDGAYDFRPRIQHFRIRIDPAAAEGKRVQVDLVRTVLLRTESGGAMTGLSSGFDLSTAPSSWIRYDAEGIRIAPVGLGAPGGFLLSEEYGPAIDLFAADGTRLRRLAIPETFRIQTPAVDPDRELPPNNTRGRQANRGFEGLAVTPDGSRALAILQSPLIQDGGLDPDLNRVGRNIRILDLGLTDGTSAQWVYPLENSRDGVSEVLAVDRSTLLVLERDSKGGREARRRGVFMANLSQATDVSQIAALPARDLPPEIRPARKRRLIDFMDPTYGLTETVHGGMPEKLEGLCFGPSLPDGRRTMIVTSDNDLKADQASWFWVFAVDAALLTNP